MCNNDLWHVGLRSAVFQVFNDGVTDGCKQGELYGDISLSLFKGYLILVPVDLVKLKLYDIPGAPAIFRNK